MSARQLVQTAPAKLSFTPARTGLLQRKCACGNHTIAGGECAECAKKNKNRLQRKLTIGASNDPLEQEADRVADQVMAAPAHSASRPIHRHAGQAFEGSGTAPASVDCVLASSGSPLEPELRQDMEQRFGHDFSMVRVHTGKVAEQSAREVNADAYTVGQNIVFDAGSFAPSTSLGQRLIAHELAHVVQQGAAPLSGCHSDSRFQSGWEVAIQNPVTVTRSEPALFRAGIVDRLRSAVSPSTRQFLSDLTASVRQSPEHFAEFFTGELLESIKAHWLRISLVTLGLVGTELLIGALEAAPTGITQIIGAVLEIAVLAVLGYFATVEVIGAAEEGLRWWSTARKANGDPKEIAQASRAFVRMVWHIFMAVLAVAGVRARIRAGAVPRIAAPLRGAPIEAPPVAAPPSAPPLRAIPGGKSGPIKIEGGRVKSGPQSPRSVGTKGPVASSGEATARDLQPQPDLEPLPSPVREVPPLPEAAEGPSAGTRAPQPKSPVTPVPFISVPVMPLGLSQSDKEQWERCSGLYKTYKATQSDLASRSAGINRLADDFKNNRASPQEVLDLCELIDELLPIVERLHRERSDYNDAGCDKFDWFARGTTEAERRAAHLGAIANVDQQLRNLRKLRKDLNCL